MKKNIVAKIYVILIMLYLYVPIAVLMLMGFNKSRYNSMPFEFSLEWYRALILNTTLQKAALNSVVLAFVTGIICVILATLFILGERYTSNKLKLIFNSVSMMPMSIPWLIMGLSLLLLIRFFALSKSMFFVTAGHVVISLPYSLLVLKARVNSMDKSLEEMSASLGANAFTTFKRITFPAISPAMIAGGFLSFMISFDNFAISYFLMPAGVSTLPIEIQSSIKFGFTPEINAVSTIIICVSLICLAVVGLIMGFSFKTIFGGNSK